MNWFKWGEKQWNTFKNYIVGYYHNNVFSLIPICDDKLIGGAGNDTLYGEAGNDTYYFEIGDGEDVINDYERSQSEG